MRPLEIDRDLLRRRLLELLAIPSPSGYTDRIVHRVCGWLETMGIETELTRRGAIRANLDGRRSSPDRAIVGHLDTLGAMVRQLKENGRLAVAPVGHWASRAAEGARVTVFGADGGSWRGTLLPLKASGHVFGDEVDSQPATWDQIELRLDELVHDRSDLVDLGIDVGDFVAVDPQPEVVGDGFVVSRHLDDKAGVAAMLAAADAVLRAGVELPVDCHLLFTILEEVGSGASAILHRDVAEMVSVDNATVALGQTSTETDVTIAVMDSTGPFDYRLTQQLVGLARDHGIPMQRDLFRHYRTDAASAVEAGNDIRTALVCFGVDASHTWERTHLSGVVRVAELLALYMQSPPVAESDRRELAPAEEFLEPGE